MKSEEAIRYVQENLGIDLGASNYVHDQAKLVKLVQEFPFKGIVLATGQNHLLKAGRLCFELLKADVIIGSIERFESWDVSVVSYSTSLLVCSNLAEDLVKPQSVVYTIAGCMKLKVPMIVTTPYAIEALESQLSISVLSNIVPYLYGEL